MRAPRPLLPAARCPSIRTRPGLLGLITGVLIATSACGPSEIRIDGEDAGGPVGADGARDQAAERSDGPPGSATPDAVAPDGGSVPVDGGGPDQGPGLDQAGDGSGGGPGADGPTDGSPGDLPTPPPPDMPEVTFGGPGPWPLAPLTVYGAAQGLDDLDVIDAAPDEAQNLWVVGRGALYLLSPGQTRFQKYTGSDGLHLSMSMPPGITAVAGGLPDEAFVGYAGTEVVDAQQDAGRHLGKVDRVRRRADGTLEVTRYDVHNNDVVGYDAQGNIDPEQTDWSYFEDRTVLRFVYDHLYHRGTLYVGYNHGVGRIDAGRIDPAIGFDYADHVHPQVLDQNNIARMGDWWGLALDPSMRRDDRGQTHAGMLWMGGKWGGGAIGWTPGLYQWMRNETNRFYAAFTDPPVFQVTNGDSIHIRAVAALGDGRVYYASGDGDGATYQPLGLAVIRIGEPTTYLDPAELGLTGGAIVDMVRLPDDTLLFAMAGGQLWHWRPDPGPRGQLLGEIGGLPGTSIRRLLVDGMVDPPAVYVATDSGLAVLRF